MKCEWCKKDFPRKMGRFCGTCKKPLTASDIEKLVQKIRDTPPEVWERLVDERAAREKELDNKCATGNHQGTLSNPTFSGADIWWRCSRCGGLELQVGGNRTMTL